MKISKLLFAIALLATPFFAGAVETINIGPGVSVTCPNSCVVNGTNISDSKGAPVRTVILPPTHR